MISFKFKLNTSREQREQILAQLNTWPEVSKAGFFGPNSKSLEVRRMAFVKLHEQVTLDTVIARRRALPDVEDVEPPTPRYLS